MELGREDQRGPLISRAMCNHRRHLRRSGMESCLGTLTWPISKGETQRCGSWMTSPHASHTLAMAPIMWPGREMKGAPLWLGPQAQSPCFRTKGLLLKGGPAPPRPLPVIPSGREVGPLSFLSYFLSSKTPLLASAFRKLCSVSLNSISQHGRTITNGAWWLACWWLKKQLMTFNQLNEHGTNDSMA